MGTFDLLSALKGWFLGGLMFLNQVSVLFIQLLSQFPNPLLLAAASKSCVIEFHN